MRSPVSEELQAHREEVYSRVADEVGAALHRAGIVEGNYRRGYKSLNKLAGREVHRTLRMIMAENDTTVSTLADLAKITGHKLEIRLVEN